MRASSTGSIWNLVPIRSVLLIVFIQTWRGQNALDSRLPAALHTKLANGEHVLKNTHDMRNRKVRHQPFEDGIRSHLSNHYESVYGNLTELSNFFQTENVDSSESSTLEDLFPESGNLLTSKRDERKVISTRTGRIAAAKNRQKRQFKKYTQNIDEAVFKTYDDCVSRRSGSFVGKQNNLKQEPVLFQEGESVTLRCSLCVRPDQDPASYEISWSAKLIGGHHEMMLKTGNGERISKDAFSLHIRRLRIGDAGVYTCYKNDLATWAYRVDILQTELREIVTESGMGGKPPAGRQAFLDLNIKLYTRWSKWSDCSQCSTQGIRRKIGICTVTKLVQGLNKPDYRVFRAYKKGIPCRSSLMPPKMKDLPAVKTRPSETLLGYCNVACTTPRPVVEKIKELLGDTFLGVIKPGKEYVKYFDVRPTIPPVLLRKTFYVPEKGAITLECPSDHDDMVRWQNATRVIRPVRLRLRERGRVLITDHYNILFRRLRPSDSGLYGCWVNGQHRTSIKLFVTEPEAVSYYDYVAVAGLVCSLLLIVIIGLSMVHIGKSKKGRKQPPYINPKQAKAVGL